MEGFYARPSSITDLSSLSEALVRDPSKGAIASFSPTGFGVATGHDLLERGLFQAIFDQYLTQVGPATTQAKFFLYTYTGAYRELIETYNLLGDPAARLPVFRPDVGIAKTQFTAGPLHPGDWITYTLSFSNSGDRLASQVVISDTLPAGLINPAVVSSSGANMTQRPGSSFIWDVADLLPGEGGAVTLTAQVDAAYWAPIVNTASIEALGDWPQALNNSAQTIALVFRDYFLPLVPK
jgi:uncharacterized repeat protein (TIGR01451 family)